MNALVHSADGVVVFLTDPGTDVPPPAPEPVESGWWPWMSEAAVEPLREELSAATSPATRLPARWSPRPVDVLRGRFACSQLAADLHQWALLVAFLAGGVAGFLLDDHLHAIAHLMFGGPL